MSGCLIPPEPVVPITPSYAPPYNANAESPENVYLLSNGTYILHAPH